MKFPGAIRDPIHGYIRLTADELRGLDTPELQRLRGIAQLGLTERVYPGARHSRFEHALGALEVATRIFEEIRGRLGVEGLLKPLGIAPKAAEFRYLITVARWVALLHDLGHAPFSHVTEELLPGGCSHEQVTSRIVRHGRVREVLAGAGATLFEDVLRVLEPGPDELPPPLAFVLDVIAGPVGADRMDYLLRDSAATGVSYGIFDLARVLHTVLPVTSPDGKAPHVRLGIERGGVLAVEGLLWGRVSMFQQVYYHHTRRILDRHLVDYLRAELPGAAYPDEIDEYLEWSDARVHEMLRRSVADPGSPGHRDAFRILRRRHHRMLPQELEADDPAALSRWLSDWRAAVLHAVPDSEPITDLIEPPPESHGTSSVLVQEGSRVRPLNEVSSLVGRLRLRPHGRLYVIPERVADAPAFPGR